MTRIEAAITCRELLAYTDYIAQRWLRYFQQHEAALDIEVGGKTGTVRNLVAHLFQVENFFAGLLDSGPSTSPTAPPSPMEKPTLDSMTRMHQDSLEKLGKYIDSADEGSLGMKRTLGPVSVSNRKILAQALIHSIHHWGQVAMEVRQGGFPAQPPQDIIISPAME